MDELMRTANTYLSHGMAAGGGGITVIVVRKIYKLLAQIGGFVSFCAFVYKLIVRWPRVALMCLSVLTIVAISSGCSSHNRVEREARKSIQPPIGVQDFGGTNYCSAELLSLKLSKALEKAQRKKIYRACVERVKNSSIFINPYNRYRRLRNGIEGKQHESSTDNGSDAGYPYLLCSDCTHREERGSGETARSVS